MGAGAVHGTPHGHLHGLQVELPALAPTGENDLQQLSYFLGGLLLDRRGRFFSSSVSDSSTGLCRQIFSLTSTKARLNSW
jgi:hypothetical protein